MKDPKKLTAENLTKAHSEGCSDVKRTLELLHPDFFKKEEDTYARGDRFTILGEDYLLSYAGNENGNSTAAFTNLENGCRLWNSFEVGDSLNITTSEINKLLEGETFKKIKS